MSAETSWGTTLPFRMHDLFVTLLQHFCGDEPACDSSPSDEVEEGGGGKRGDLCLKVLLKNITKVKIPFYFFHFLFTMFYLHGSR